MEPCLHRRRKSGGPGPPNNLRGGANIPFGPPNNSPICTSKTIPLNSILEFSILSYIKMRNVIIWHWLIKNLMGTRRRNDGDATLLRRIDVVTSCACWEFGPPLGPPKILNLGPPNILNLPTPMVYGWKSFSPPLKSEFETSRSEGQFYINYPTWNSPAYKWISSSAGLMKTETKKCKTLMQMLSMDELTDRQVEKKWIERQKEYWYIPLNILSISEV